jgi:hypothetical protein
MKIEIRQTIAQPYFQAHCQSFVKELANPRQDKIVGSSPFTWV